MSHNEAAVSYDDVTRKRKDDWSSQQVAFRHFNNCVKKSLIQFALNRVAAVSAAASTHGAAVLDLASGRGGDLGKWAFMQSQPSGSAPSAVYVSRYDCYDVSPECISEAERRCTELANTADKPLNCKASFTVADCFSEAFLKHTLPTSPMFGHYHVVTIQFAFHYACQSEALIRDVLTAVSAALVPGGLVLITTVDNHVLSQRAMKGQLRNPLFHIEFPEAPQFGSGDEVNAAATLLTPCTKYHFTLEGFVDCAEFVVPTETVVRLAKAVQLMLRPDVSKPFAHFVHEYAANRKLNKGNKLSPSEVELVTLYQSLVFEKARS